MTGREETALRMIVDIAEGSTTANSLQHIAKIARQALSTTDDLYHQLLYAVGRKYPGETRHETALRYIRQAEEAHESEGAQSDKP
jgi:hypothetical protein